MRRLMAATFHRRGYFVTAAVQFRSLLVKLACGRDYEGVSRVIIGRVTGVFAKMCGPTPEEWANLRKHALETTRERIAKICAPPKSYSASRLVELLLF